MSKPVFRKMVLNHVTAEFQDWTSVQMREVPRTKVRAEVQKLLDLLLKSVTEDDSWEYSHLKEALMYYIGPSDSIESSGISEVEIHERLAELIASKLAAKLNHTKRTTT